MIADRLSWNGELPVWSWQWTEKLSSCDEQQLDELKNLLVDAIFPSNTQDRWCWVPDSVGLFSVNSCYNLLLQSCNTIVLDSNVAIAVKKLWKNDVPSKVNVFGWRLLLEKLPTRAALNHR
ncbi:heat shock protein, partial [Trifolium pratense]